MTQEEKARRYEEALERARDLVSKDNVEVAEYIFPELAELNDERIRKAIIKFFELEDDNTTYCLVPKKDILAWLEKQACDSDGDSKSFAKEYDKYIEPFMAEDIRCQPFKSLYDCAKHFYKLGFKSKKYTWSEEDEHRFKDTIYFLDTAKKHYASTVELDACIDWLNSLKKMG